MKFILPASGKPKDGLFRMEITSPKCLFTLKSGVTILDTQMKVLSSYGFPITIVLGWEGEQIINHCRDMEYDVNFVWDNDWANAHSLTRMINDLPHVFNDEHILIFSDTIFTNELIDYLLSREHDIAKCANARKFSRRGAEAMVKTIQFNHQIEDLNAPLFFKIQELHPDITVEFRESQPVWQFDIDNHKELVRARRMNL